MPSPVSAPLRSHLAPAASEERSAVFAQVQQQAAVLADLTQRVRLLEQRDAAPGWWARVRRVFAPRPDAHRGVI